MEDGAGDQEQPSSLPARVGVTALNLVAPGLGLVRLGALRPAVLFLLAPYVLIALITVGIGSLPVTSYARVVSALVVVLGLTAALYVVPAVLTWRRSRLRAPARGWARWNGVVAIGVLALLASQLATPLMRHFYRPFYAPSESMAPTIGKGDRFIADMRWRGPPRRGDVIVFNGPDNIRVSRVAAVGGDRIAMRGGVPIVNGAPVVQRPHGQATFTGYDDTHAASVLIERLPGEAMAHRVLDAGPSAFDDAPEVVVPAGHVFVLGDDRDRSADSRVPAALAGVGMVPLGAIIGRPMYISWSSDHATIGTRLDR